jgi:hypothetical protein
MSVRPNTFRRIAVICSNSSSVVTKAGAKKIASLLPPD